jgi:hypothetical protein
MNPIHDTDALKRSMHLDEVARSTAQWQRDIAKGHGPIPVFRVTLDVAEPDDLDFRRSVAVRGVTMRYTGVQNPSYEYEFSALTRESLVDMIEVVFADGTGDMSYLTDLITEGIVVA